MFFYVHFMFLPLVNKEGVSIVCIDKTKINIGRKSIFLIGIAPWDLKKLLGSDES